MNQLTNIFYNSKQYFIFHCRQTSRSVFVFFIQWKLFFLSRWCLCHDGSLSNFRIDVRI